MSKRSLYIIFGTVAVAILVFIILFVFKTPEEKEKQKEQVDWKQDFKNTSRQPYGTYLFYEILKHNTKSFGTVKGDPAGILKLKSKDGVRDLLIVFENDFENYDYDTWDYLVDFINGGNNVLLIETFDPYKIEKYYDETATVSSREKKKETTHFINDKTEYEFEYLNNFEPESHNWTYFTLKKEMEYEVGKDGLYQIANSEEVNELYFHELNELKQPIFAEFIYEGGSVYFYRNPVAFTNLYLINEHYVEHLEKVLSKLKYDNIIYNIPDAKPKEKKKKPKVSPLQFILSNPSLTWAYVVTLVGIALFFIFNLKRKQKAVPILPPKQNTTLEYVDAISKVYYQKHSNHNLVVHKNRIFTTFIRSRYHINLNKDINAYAQSIAIRSGLEKEEILGILKRLEQYQKQQTVSDEQLIELHKKIDSFYKNCK